MQQSHSETLHIGYACLLVAAGKSTVSGQRFYPIRKLSPINERKETEYPNSEKSTCAINELLVK